MSYLFFIVSMSLFVIALSGVVLDVTFNKVAQMFIASGVFAIAGVLA